MSVVEGGDVVDRFNSLPPGVVVVADNPTGIGREQLLAKLEFVVKAVDTSNFNLVGRVDAVEAFEQLVECFVDGGNAIASSKDTVHLKIPR